MTNQIIFVLLVHIFNFYDYSYSEADQNFIIEINCKYIFRLASERTNKTHDNTYKLKIFFIQ